MATLLLQCHSANQNAPDNKNAATFWRGRPLTQWECRISSHKKYHMQQKHWECRVSIYSKTACWRRRPLSQWKCRIFRHNKTTCYWSVTQCWWNITCLQFLSDICLNSYPAKFDKYLMTFRWERNHNVSLCQFLFGIFHIKSITAQKFGLWPINFFIFS